MCSYCGVRVRGDDGRYTADERTCGEHRDLPGLAPLEPESAWIRMVRNKTQVLDNTRVAA